MADFAFHDHGSLCILVPLSGAAADWRDANLADAMEWNGGVVIEPRYAPAILDGIEDDGLSVGG